MEISSDTVSTSLLGKNDQSHASSTSVVVSCRGGTGAVSISKDGFVEFKTDEVCLSDPLLLICLGSGPLQSLKCIRWLCAQETRSSCARQGCCGTRQQILQVFVKAEILKIFLAFNHTSMVDGGEFVPFR